MYMYVAVKDYADSLSEDAERMLSCVQQIRRERWRPDLGFGAWDLGIGGLGLGVWGLGEATGR